MGSVVAVVFAAGSGSRFGGRKQFARIDGQRLVDMVVGSASSVCDELILVLPATCQWDGQPVSAVVSGGSSHGESVRAGVDVIADVAPKAEIVVLASPSHPLASPALFERVVGAVQDGADAAAPIARLTDALVARSNRAMTGSVDKSSLVSIQAPGAVRRTILEAALASGIAAPEEMELVHRFGAQIVLVDGEATNLHITTPMELEMARRIHDLAGKSTDNY